MKIKLSDIPPGKSIDDYPEDTVFVLDDRPAKYDANTGTHILPGAPEYDKVRDPRFD